MDDGLLVETVVGLNLGKLGEHVLGTRQAQGVSGATALLTRILPQPPILRTGLEQHAEPARDIAQKPAYLPLVVDARKLALELPQIAIAHDGRDLMVADGLVHAHGLPCHSALMQAVLRLVLHRRGLLDAVDARLVGRDDAAQRALVDDCLVVRQLTDDIAQHLHATLRLFNARELGFLFGHKQRHHEIGEQKRYENDARPQEDEQLAALQDLAGAHNARDGEADGQRHGTFGTGEREQKGVLGRLAVDLVALAVLADPHALHPQAPHEANRDEHDGDEHDVKNEGFIGIAASPGARRGVGQKRAQQHEAHAVEREGDDLPDA